MTTVVLDPGHGGDRRVGGSSPNNSRGTNGLLEKALTLDLARRLPSLLAGVADVVLTRTGDTNLALTDRARVARDRHAALFVSLHLNGFHDPDVDGTEVWVARAATTRSRDFARGMLAHLADATGVSSRGVKEGDLGVLLPERHDPQTAACLAEISFLTNPDQARRLADESYKQRLAEAMAAAIRQQLPARAAAGQGLAAATNGHTAAFDAAPKIAGWIAMEFEGVNKIKGTSENLAFYLTSGGSNDQKAHFRVRITNKSDSYGIFRPVVFVRLAKRLAKTPEGESWQTIPLEKQSEGKSFYRFEPGFSILPGKSHVLRLTLTKDSLAKAYNAFLENPYALLRVELEARPAFFGDADSVVRQRVETRFALVQSVDLLSKTTEFVQTVVLNDPKYRDEYATLVWSKVFTTASTKPSEVKFTIESSFAETDANETTDTRQIVQTTGTKSSVEIAPNIGFALGKLAEVGKQLTGSLGIKFSHEWSQSLAKQYTSALRTLRSTTKTTTVRREVVFEIPPTPAGKTVNLYLCPIFKLFKVKVVRFGGPDENGQATSRAEEYVPLMLFTGWQELQPEVVDTAPTAHPPIRPTAPTLPAPAIGAPGSPRSQALQAAREVTFKPEVITVSSARRAEILKKAGWKQASIAITMKNFQGEPLRGYKVFAEFKAPGVASMTEAGNAEGGSITWSNVWLKPEGTVRVMAVSLGKPALVPEGVQHYRLPDRGLLRLDAAQEGTEVTVTAETSQEAAEKVGVTGTVGVDFEVVQIGGEVSGESERKHGSSRSITWKVILPTSTFKVTQV